MPLTGLFHEALQIVSFFTTELSAAQLVIATLLSYFLFQIFNFYPSIAAPDSVEDILSHYILHFALRPTPDQDILLISPIFLLRNCRKITDATCLGESPEIQRKRL